MKYLNRFKTILSIVILSALERSAYSVTPISYNVYNITPETPLCRSMGQMSASMLGLAMTNIAPETAMKGSWWQSNKVDIITNEDDYRGVFQKGSSIAWSSQKIILIHLGTRRFGGTSYSISVNSVNTDTIDGKVKLVLDCTEVVDNTYSGAFAGISSDCHVYKAIKIPAGVQFSEVIVTWKKQTVS